MTWIWFRCGSDGFLLDQFALCNRLIEGNGSGQTQLFGSVDNVCSEKFETDEECAAIVIRFDGYCYSLFKYVLDLSVAYRDLVLSHLSRVGSKNCVKVNVKLCKPCHVIDYRWNDMLTGTCRERRELEWTMSWLSTFGGAYSSLGDQRQSCALVAGKISARQLELALRLGDPITVIRCKLYWAISLIQMKQFHLASKVIKKQYLLAWTYRNIDARLISMCLGIWTKLKYERSIYKTRGLS